MMRRLLSVFCFLVLLCSFGMACDRADRKFPVADVSLEERSDSVVSESEVGPYECLPDSSSSQFEISLLCLLFSGIIILFVIRLKVVARIRFLNIISQKELEISSYKSSLELAESVKRENLIEIKTLRNSLTEYENELSVLKDICKVESDDYQRMCVCVSIVNGLNICRDALAGKKRTTLQPQDYRDVIAYYQVIDAAFIVALERGLTGLTVQDKLMCILFRIGLNHQQVADFLGNTSATLSRRKSRLKSKYIHADTCKLEDLICTL